MKHIRRLTINDIEDFKHVNLEIKKNLINCEWYHPFSLSTIEYFFSNKNTHVVLGCYIGGEIAAVSLYDYDKAQCAWLSKACGVDDKKQGAELGGSMVLPKFRGQGIMYDINEKLREEAIKQGLDYFVATAHPDNIASNKNIIKQGFKFISTGFNPNGIIRNIYLLEF